MPFYKHHVFFCTNVREDGSPSCGQFNAQDARDYLKARAKQLGEHGEGFLRINSAGCLGRCEKGPVMVVYPEATWYTYIDKEDLDEIFDEHLRGGKQVERLRLDK